VIRLWVGEAVIEVAASSDRREQLLGPYHPPAGSGERRVQDATTA
jgi:hypothetical protein